MMRRVSLLVCLVVFVGGCACTEKVVVENRSTQQLQLQIALPWPSYTAPSRRGCHFNVNLAPKQKWFSKQATSEQHIRLSLLQPNGVLLIRLRTPQSSWVTHALISDEPLESLDPISITIYDVSQTDASMRAINDDGREIHLKKVDDEYWFGESLAKSSDDVLF